MAKKEDDIHIENWVLARPRRVFGLVDFIREIFDNAFVDGRS